MGAGVVWGDESAPAAAASFSSVVAVVVLLISIAVSYTHLSAGFIFSKWPCCSSINRRIHCPLSACSREPGIYESFGHFLVGESQPIDVEFFVIFLYREVAALRCV